jgi:hypothetical protein
MLKQRIEKFVGKKDDPVSGPHSFWVHFWFGFVLGGLSGAYWGWKIPQSLGLVSRFESPGLFVILLVALCGALLVGAGMARWGDRFWS